MYTPEEVKEIIRDFVKCMNDPSTSVLYGHTYVNIKAMEDWINNHGLENKMTLNIAKDNSEMSEYIHC